MALLIPILLIAVVVVVILTLKVSKNIEDLENLHRRMDNHDIWLEEMGIDPSKGHDETER